jgi:hypothetical protein
MNTQHREPRHQGRRAALMATVASAALGGLLGAANPAQAQPILQPDGSYSLAFNVNVGENPAPFGTPEWLTAVISPIAGGNGVTIDLLSSLKSPTEFITAVGFNLTQSIQPFSWSCESGSQINCSSAKVDVVEDFNNSPKINFQNEAKGFDLAIYLPVAMTDDRLMGSDTARFTLNAPGLNPEWFLSTNVPTAPGSVTGLWAAARVQGTGPDGEGSTTIADPPASEVPGPLPLLGAGVALGYSRRLRQRLSHGAA